MPTTSPTTAPTTALVPPVRRRAPVLLATDGTSRTPAAIHAALHVAERLGAPLAVVGVLPPMPIYGLGEDIIAVSPAVAAERRAELSARIRAALETAVGPRTVWALDIREGRHGEQIAAAADACGAALVVVGSGAHDLPGRLLAEETAVTVTRAAHAPVLAVPAGWHGTFSCVVVALDFGAPSVCAAETAARLVRGARGARLVLVHVRPTPTLTVGAPTGDAARHVSLRLEHLRDRLRAIAGDDVLIETRTPVGEIAATLLEIAQAVEADLLAVGTHGPNWLERLLIGSTATTLLRRVHRPLLVAPPPDAATRLRIELDIDRLAVTRQPADWAEALALFTERNHGSAASLEATLGMDAALRTHVRTARFRGAAHDPRANQVQVMLEAPAGHTGHVTHALDAPTRVEIIAADAMHDRALIVEGREAILVLELLAPTGSAAPPSS